MLSIETVFKVNGKEFTSYAEAEKYALDCAVKEEENHIFFYNFNLEHLNYESWDACMDSADYILITTERAKQLLIAKCSRRDLDDVENLPAPVFLYYDTILEMWTDIKEHIIYLEEELKTYNKVKQTMISDLENSEKKI